MPIEYTLLKNQAVPLESYPKCGARPFRPFLRGQVQRSPWKWWQLWGKKRPYCALICWECKEIVFWESPPLTHERS